MIRLSFNGALSTVGASAVLVDTGIEKILLDYGTKIREVPPQFPIPIQGKPDAILLSHCHLDHCLHPDTYIQLSSGEIMKIDEIYENKFSDFVCLNSELKLTNAPSSRKVKIKAPKELVRIRAQSGWIDCSPEHRFFVLDGLDLTEKQAFKLREGEFVAFVRRVNIIEGGSIDLVQFRKKIKSKPIKIKFPEKTTPELCQFIGYVVGDGNKDKNGIKITDKDVENLRFYQNLAKKIFGIGGSIYFDSRQRLCFTSRPLLEFLLQFDGILEKSKKRKIPKIIHKLSKKEIASFLRGLFDAEGSVCHHHVVLRTASENILHVVQLLLLRFGIFSIKYDESKYTKKAFGKTSYGLYIYDVDSLKKFKNIIGFSSNKKSRRLKALVKKIGKSKIPKINLVPLSSDVLAKINKELRIFTTDFLKEGVSISHYLKSSHFPSRKKLSEVIKVIEKRLKKIEKLNGDVAKKRKILRLYQWEVANAVGKSQTWVSQFERGKIKTKEQEKKILKYLEAVRNEMIRKGRYYLEKLKKIENSDIIWTKIMEIKKIKSKCKYLYDLTIPDYSNYIANGFVVHNSGGLAIFSANGQNCPIYSVNVTKPLTELLLLDSLKISHEEGVSLPFKKRDVEQTMRNFVLIPYRKQFKLRSTKFEFFDAGHIPGSSMILLSFGNKNLLYTGDLKTTDTRLLKKADLNLPKIDYLITESTYSDREHANRKEQEKELVKIIDETLAVDGHCLIAGFAVGRLQEILLVLDKYGIDYPIYLDGMAKKATTIINHYKKLLKEPESLDKALSKVEYVSSPKQRKRILRNPSVILTTSGMLNGGPIVWYLKKLYSNERSSLILTGWQLEDTPGKILLETGRFITKDVNLEVKMFVKRLDFSAHAGRTELFEVVEKLNPEKIFCIHGDHTEEFASELRKKGFEAIAPLANNRVFNLL